MAEISDLTMVGTLKCRRCVSHMLTTVGMYVCLSSRHVVHVGISLTRVGHARNK